MLVQFKNLKPIIVEGLAERLVEQGFKADEDFDVLYEGAYVLYGIQSHDVVVVKAIVNLLIG